MTPLLAARWSDCLRDMLQINPELRRSASEVLESSLFLGCEEPTREVSPASGPLGKSTPSRQQSSEAMQRHRIEEFGGCSEIVSCQITSEQLRVAALQQQQEMNVQQYLQQQQQQQYKDPRQMLTAGERAGPTGTPLRLSARGGAGHRVNSLRVERIEI